MGLVQIEKSTSLNKLSDVDITNKQDGQFLAYDDTLHKWIAKSGSEEVVELTQAEYDELSQAKKFNGLIYQISDKGYFYYKEKRFRATKELTQAEYDRLSPEQKNDGTQYLISDAKMALNDLDDVNASSATDGQFLTYDASTDTWINGGGKTVYADVVGTLEAGQTSITLTSPYITTTSAIEEMIDNSFDGVKYISRSISTGSITYVFPVQATDMPVKVRIWVDGIGSASVRIDDTSITPNETWSSEKINEELENRIASIDIAPIYNNTNTYNEGDVVIYEGDIYINITGVDFPEDFDPTKWTQVSITQLLGAKTLSKLEDVEISGTPTTKQTLRYNTSTNKWENSSFNEGNYATSTLTGSYAHIEGDGVTASGVNSHAEGGGTTASGSCAHAEGGSTNATGNYSHAEGGGTTASGLQSHAEGAGVTASGDCSHAEGGGTTASGDCSHTEGSNTLASKMCSHAEGTNTTASGDYSHAEGESTIASGITSHAEGASTTASSAQAHAEGGGTTASGLQSHAEGANTVASGTASHAEGSATIAAGANQHVSGKFNIADNNNTYAEIIGNGTADNARSNARTLDWQGNEVLAGDLTINGNVSISTALGSIPTVLNDLDDVDTSGVFSGDLMLKYDSQAGKWVPDSFIQSDWNESNLNDPAYIINKPSIPSGLDDLSDVDVSTNLPTNGQVLAYNSTNRKWENTTTSSSINLVYDRVSDSGKSISNDTATDIHDLVVYRIVESGLYLINGGVAWEADPQGQHTGRRSMRIDILDGATLISQSQYVTDVADLYTTRQSISWVASLTAGNKITIGVRQRSGTGIFVMNPWLQVIKLA